MWREIVLRKLNALFWRSGMTWERSSNEKEEKIEREIYDCYPGNTENIGETRGCEGGEPTEVGAKNYRKEGKSWKFAGRARGGTGGGGLTHGGNEGGDFYLTKSQIAVKLN